MTNKNWCVWSCANGREDELYASDLSEADAELVATECNIVADELGELVEFRPAPKHHLFVTEQQKEMLQELISLQYYSHEFAGNTWDDIPPELVAKGLKGLEDFIRIMDWSINKRDPYSVKTSEDIPF